MDSGAAATQPSGTEEGRRDGARSSRETRRAMSKSENEMGEKGIAASAGQTRQRYGQQIDGGWHIAIYDKAKQILIAEIVTTPATGTLTIDAAKDSGFSPNTNPPTGTEMWWFDGNQLSKLTGDIYIASTQITGDSVTLLDKSFDPKSETFKSNESTTWQEYHVRSDTPAFKGLDQYQDSDKILYLRILVETGAVTKVKWFEAAKSPPTFIVPKTGDWSFVATVPHGAYQVAFSRGSGS
jgi:hypothetical protein